MMWISGTLPIDNADRAAECHDDRHAGKRKGIKPLKPCGLDLKAFDCEGNVIDQIQQAIALSTNDYERKQLIDMQREIMRAQASIEATMAAYQRQLSKPDLGESLMGLFGGAIGGLLTAPIGGIGMGLGSGLGNAIGGAISGPDPYLEYIKSLRR